MAAGKETEKASDSVRESVQIHHSRFAENGTVSGENASSFVPASTSNLLGNNMSAFNSGDPRHSKATSDLDFYYTPNSTYNYVYPGYDGSYTRWNNHGYYVSGEGSIMSNHAHFLKPCSHYTSASERTQGVQKISPFFQGQGGNLPSDSSINIRSNPCPWIDNRVGERQKVNQRRHSEGFSDVICGPRANRRKCLLSLSEDKKSLNPYLNADLCNLPDFPIKYENARFFMIKSYNEDDVHKSIKYNVWASTPSGNKKLDDAFHEAVAKIKEGSTKYPIFLFFSVNTSGQFVGVAEMTGHVDFKKSMDFWQEERWNGFFPIRWHIIKDVPNLEFRSIILENNDNRPVFFSRDTQEIRLPQGIKMLQIFKNYSVETSILDDFGFYDLREKTLRARRGCIPSLVHQAGDGRGFTAMSQLEEAMQRVELSSKPKNHHLI